MKHAVLLFLPLSIALASAASSQTGAIGGGRLFRFAGKRDFAGFYLSHARWNSAAGAIVFQPAKSGPDEALWGLVESPDIEIGFAAREMVVSWNSQTPPGSYLKVYIRTRSGGFWSRRFAVAIWNRDNRPVDRMSVNGQGDDIASMETDILRLKRPADAFRVSAKLCSTDGRAYPTLRLLSAYALGPRSPAPRLRARKSVWGTDLIVPERSQLTIPEGSRFCSATSTAMVLDYWARDLDRPELSVSLEEAVAGIYDREWGGTGNWPFNTAYAAEFGGLRAYVTRFSGLAMIEDWIGRGVPVVVSVDYNVLMKRDTEQSMGHLMVLRGFTRDGDCIINDPYTHLDRGESVRKVFKREDFVRSWLGEKASHGTVYLIYPEGWKPPANRYLAW